MSTKISAYDSYNNQIDQIAPTIIIICRCNLIKEHHFSVFSCFWKIKKVHKHSTLDVFLKIGGAKTQLIFFWINEEKDREIDMYR